MPIQRKHRDAASSLVERFVERITHVTYDGATGGVTTPDGCWDLVFRKRRGALEVLQTGVITRPISLDYEPGDEYLSVSFKPGVFMPMLPGARMVDHAIVRPTVSRRTFWLDGDVIEVPTFENAEGLVARLAKGGLLTRDEIVTRALGGDGRILSARAAQRHFRHALGITSKALQQMQRAQSAATLLRHGRPIGDVVQELGFADQAHLTRSLKVLLGQTPGAIVRLATAAPR